MLTVPEKPFRLVRVTWDWLEPVIGTTKGPRVAKPNSAGVPYTPGVVECSIGRPVALSIIVSSKMLMNVPPAALTLKVAVKSSPTIIVSTGGGQVVVK